MTTDLTPARLWMSLSPEIRMLAARSYDWKTPETRREAVQVIARSLKFRDEFVRKLPLEKRIGYLAMAVRADDSIATTLLLSLHLAERRPMLAAFLDALAIKHDDGLISEGQEISPPTAGTLASAAAVLDSRFPVDEVTLYLTSLVAIDPDTWSGLRETLEKRNAWPVGTPK